jgi:NAD+ kinase
VKIGLLYHPGRQQAHALATVLHTVIQKEGHEAWHVPVEAEADWHELVPTTDLLFTLGGDGSILRAAPLCAQNDVPIVGVKFGRLGFLSELLPKEAIQMLPRYLNEEYWIEERSMLDCQIEGEAQKTVALNEAVISQGHVRRVLDIKVWIDDAFLADYVADGLMISTATGSTAYSMVAGGPILHPEVRNLLITPMYSLLGPTTPFVLRQSARLRLQVFHQHEAVVTIDGLLVGDLPNEGMMHLTTATQTCKFARVQERTYFYETLVRKLRIPLDGS